MAKKPFSIIAERLGEILALCREIRAGLPGTAAPMECGSTAIAVVAQDDDPCAERMRVRVPAEAQVGDVVSYSGRLGFDTLFGFGVIRELHPESTAAKKMGTALKIWRGPGIPVEGRHE